MTVKHSICLFVCHLTVCVSILLSIFFLHLLVGVFIILSVCPSGCPSACLSVALSFFHCICMLLHESACVFASVSPVVTVFAGWFSVCL